MKDCELLQAENQSLKTSATNSKLSLDQLQRDYDQLLIQNRYLEDENKRKTPNDDSMAKESLKKMSQLIRDKDEEIVSLKQRVDSLLNTIESERQKISEDEKMEQINKLSNELSRLREHLIAVEDGYTQELVVAEERENELRIRLKAMEEQLEAIQNRFQAERYEEQIRSLCTQRDIARNEVSQLDDKLQQYAASVANLQLVIEQIQKENERKLQFAERQHRIELEAEKARTEDVLKKLKSQENRFADTLEALGAASRLSESIDIKEQTIAQMKIEASKKDSLIYALRQEIDELKASFEGKVDKQIMKSLIIGYFVAPQDKRHEVERLLARFLDFNQQEMERAKIVIGRKRTPSGNWIPFFSGSTSDSLSLKFVQFLENESKPNPTEKPLIPSKEIARDLSKSLITNTSQQQRSNPFLASASPISLSSLGSRNSSTNSSTDNLNNQLLMGPTMTSFTPLIVSTPNSDESISRNNSNNDILRNVFEKQ
jgi:myosin heavy subunit